MLEPPLVQTTIENMYLVNFSVGNPPVRQFAAMDTGSNLVWLICNSQPRTLKYDPSKSSTYKNISCISDECHNVKDFFCDDSGGCMYEKAYASGQNSTGFVAYEEFVFDTADEGIAAINDVIFGCKACNVQTVGELYSSTGFYGVFGLRPSIPSFIHNLNDSKKFSLTALETLEITHMLLINSL